MKRFRNLGNITQLKNDVIYRLIESINKYSTHPTDNNYYLIIDLITEYFSKKPTNPLTPEELKKLGGDYLIYGGIEDDFETDLNTFYIEYITNNLRPSDKYLYYSSYFFDENPE